MGNSAFVFPMKYTDLRWNFTTFEDQKVRKWPILTILYEFVAISDRAKLDMLVISFAEVPNY